MKARRVRSGELFLLGDDINKLAARADSLSQQNVSEDLASALRYVLSAAKSAAFNEAHDEHLRWVAEQQACSESEKKP